MARRTPGLRAHTAGGAGGSGTRQPTGEMRSPRSLRWAIAKAKDDAKWGEHEVRVSMDRKTFEYGVERFGNLASYQVLIAIVRPDGGVEYTALGKLKAQAAKALADPKVAAKVKKMAAAKEPRAPKQKKITMTQALKAARFKSGRDPALRFRIGRDVAVAIRDNPRSPSALDIAATAALRLEDRHAVRMPRDPVTMAKALANVATVVGLGSIDQAMEGWRIVLGCPA